MQPIKNNVLFKPFPSNEVSSTGLIIPENIREINNKGTVVKVGNGTAARPMRLKEGMIGYRVKDWGTEIIIDNELYFLMDEQAILSTE